MEPATVTVTTAQQLLEATRTGITEIVVDGTILGMPMITLLQESLCAAEPCDSAQRASA